MNSEPNQARHASQGISSHVLGFLPRRNYGCPFQGCRCLGVNNLGRGHGLPVALWLSPEGQIRANQALPWHTTNMRTSQEAVEQLDDHALLDLVERALAVLADRPLDGAVGDDQLAESVQRLHRLETMTAAESCGGSPRSTSARPGGPKVPVRQPTCWRGG
jgi:hypothetical protein